MRKSPPAAMCTIKWQHLPTTIHTRLRTHSPGMLAAAAMTIALAQTFEWRQTNITTTIHSHRRIAKYTEECTQRQTTLHTDLNLT